MNIKSRIIPAKPRSKELLNRYAYSGGGSSNTGGSTGGGTGGSPSYWELVDTDSEGNPLEVPYILTKYSAVSEGELTAFRAGDEEDEEPSTNTGVTTLKELSDTIINNPINGNILIYNGTHWENKPQSELTAGGTGGDIDLSNKVDKVTGKSLILDTEILRLSSVTNQTKTSLGLDNVTNDEQATKTEFNTHTGNTTVHITSTERTNWNKAYTDSHTHSNKTQLDTINQNLSKTSNVQFNDVSISSINDNNKSVKDFIDRFNDMFELDNGAIKAKYNLYSVGEISAYGDGSGSENEVIAALSQLTDVSIITPINGQSLVYNGSEWVNQLVEGGGGNVDISGKVDKVAGKSLILDTEINRLSNVTNQDLTPYIKTTTVNTALNNKVDKVANKSLIADSEITRLSSVTNQDISGKVDKVAGYSLIANTEINRLSSVVNQTKSSIGLSNVTNDKQATKTEFDAHDSNSTKHLTSTERSNWNTAYTNNHTHNNKSNLDIINQNLSKTSNVQFNDVALQGILDTNKSLISFVDRFNDMFEIKNGAIQAKYSLYSLGEVAAYTTTSSGISSIKLMGDMNANNFNIKGVKNIDTKTLTGLANLSLTTKITVPTVSSTNGTFTNRVEAKEVKIGKFTLKEDNSGRLGIYVNNSQKAHIDTNGNYTKL